MAPLKADNFGIGGNTTQTLLWQIQHDGVLDGLSPQMVVLLIGTNNLGAGQSPDQTFAGIAADVAAIQAKQPQAQVLLLGILPRGANADDPMRSMVGQTNELLTSLGTLSHVTYRDIGAAFLQGDGSISPAIMGDYLHPTFLGYEAMAMALMPWLDQGLESPALLHNPSPAASPAVPTSNVTVDALGSNADSMSIILSVLPSGETAPVLAAPLPSPTLQNGFPVLTETPATADATVVTGSASDPYAAHTPVMGVGRGHSLDAPDVVDWSQM
jgi:lysophospholipase L1-like esterase